ncbi:DNA repair and recombination protein RadA [Natronorubrum sp. DTA7]|uniref:DNA repair and recombination protein RadA n=1 Tax=Natronorubrum sp. DTA7 TaxID=3447016 RepID=UPI003F875710
MTEKLENLPGVGPATAEKLTEAGYDSLQSLAVSAPPELAKVTDIDKNTAGEIIRGARDAADVGGFQIGEGVLERQNRIKKLSTGHDGFDDLLGGGVETQSVTEVYGNEGSGRTAFAHLLAVRAQLPEEYGGLGGQAAYIDTRRLFDPERVIEIVNSFSPDKRTALAEQYDCSANDLDSIAESVLDHIHVQSPTDSNSQMLAAEQVQELGESLAEQGRPLRIVVLDSLTIHFRAEYQGRGELAERQQKLNKHLHDLDKVANLQNAAILITNSTGSSGDAYGGNILGHKSTFRIQFKKTSGEVRHGRLIDAPNLSTGEVSFYIRNGLLVSD